MKKFIKNNWSSLIVTIILIAGLTFLTASDYIIVKETIAERGGDCWIWILNEEGNGFGDTINHCPQTKRNCENVNLGLPCEWVEYENNISGCRCWFTQNVR